MAQENINIRQHAINAIHKFENYSGNEKGCDINNSNVYGIALKYMIFTKNMSFAKASKMLGYKSPQSFNYVLNKRQEQDFFREEITFFCSKLQINENMFLNLCKEIKYLLLNGKVN